MAQANVFYKGEEKKFAINIEADGFDMEADDFDIEVTNGKDSVSVQKAGEPAETGVWINEDGSLVVFYEEDTTTQPATKNWFAIVDTKFFNHTGQLNVIATAHIPDDKAYDGVRDSIDIKTLGTLKSK